MQKLSALWARKLVIPSSLSAGHSHVTQFMQFISELGEEWRKVEQEKWKKKSVENGVR